MSGHFTSSKLEGDQGQTHFIAWSSEKGYEVSAGGAAGCGTDQQGCAGPNLISAGQGKSSPAAREKIGCYDSAYPIFSNEICLLRYDQCYFDIRRIRSTLSQGKLKGWHVPSTLKFARLVMSESLLSRGSCRAAVLASRCQNPAAQRGQQDVDVNYGLAQLLFPAAILCNAAARFGRSSAIRHSALLT